GPGRYWAPPGAWRRRSGWPCRRGRGGPAGRSTSRAGRPAPRRWGGWSRRPPAAPARWRRRRRARARRRGRGCRPGSPSRSAAPAAWLRGLARARARHPWLNRAVGWVSRRVRDREGTIQRGVGKGLRFHPGGGPAGYLLGTAEPLVQAALAALLRPGMVVYDG